MDDGRDELIAELHAQGLSIRAIAKRVGLGRSRVHEIVTALRAADEPDDGDDDEDPWEDEGDEGGLALLDAQEGYEPVASFRFVGLATELVRLPGCDTAERMDTERFPMGTVSASWTSTRHVTNAPKPG
jgi:hypothetical protein